MASEPIHKALGVVILCYVLISIEAFAAIAVLFVGFYLLIHHIYPAPPMTTRRKLMMATWDDSNGTVYGVINCNAEPLVAFLDKHKDGPEKITLTTACLKALALSFREAPGLNCRILAGRFLPHKTIDLSCLVALDDGKDLASAKIVQCDKKKMVDIQQELNAKALKLRQHQDKDFEASKPLLKILPVWLVRPMVALVGYIASGLGLDVPIFGIRAFPFGSAMVTSVGMLGVEQGFIPFTPFARVPVLLMIGAIAKKPAVVDDQIVIQNQLSLTATIDHRFADGTEAAKCAKRLKYLIEHPEELDKHDDDDEQKKHK